MTRDFERTLTKRTKSVLNISLFKKIDKENIKELLDIEKDNLFHNVIT